MFNTFRNIFKTNSDLGNWTYLFMIIAIPVFLFAKLIGVQNKTYERKDYP